jgi:6,7-dimethyl-8-ribityllumazine synthase
MAKILIVEARFYAHLNDLLLEGATAALSGHEVEVVTVPGALEVPGAIALAGECGEYAPGGGLGGVFR